MAYKSESSAYGILLDFDFRIWFDALNNEDAGKLIKNIYASINGNELQEVSPMVKTAQEFMLIKVRGNIDNYNKKCKNNSHPNDKTTVNEREQSQTTVNEREQSQTNDPIIYTNVDIDTFKYNNGSVKEKRPPTCEEIENYLSSKNITKSESDIQRYYCYFKSEKGKNYLAIWQDKLDSFIKEDEEKAREKKKSQMNDYEQRAYSDDEISAITLKKLRGG